MGVILDTSILVAVERGQLDLRARLESLGGEPLAISAVSASELLHGVHRARDEAQRSQRSRFVERWLGNLPVAEFGIAEARAHARLWASLAAAGTSVGARDLLIAATAIAIGFRLASRNLRDFERIPELTTEVWT